MPVNTKVKDTVNKIFDGGLPTADDIRFLLSIEAHSVDSGFIMGCADEVNRTAKHGKAEVHAQIGLNLSPCPK